VRGGCDGTQIPGVIPTGANVRTNPIYPRGVPATLGRLGRQGRGVSLALATLLATVVLPLAAAAQSPGAASFRRAAEYSKGERGDAVLVMVDGRIVFEDYKEGESANRTHLLASGTKSFTGLLALAAVEDGLLTLDEPVANTIHEWRNDPQRSAMTVRQLLTLTGGLEAGRHGFPPAYGEAVTSAMRAAPGEKFLYGPNPFQLFGELLRRKLAPRNETVGRYLQRRLLVPIGMQVGFWRGLLQGQPQLPHGAYLTAREWAKVGEFVRNNGRVGTRQVIRADLMPLLAEGTAANPMYGLTWWLNQPIDGALREEIRQLEDNMVGVDRVPGLEGMIMAAGAFKQRLYVIPAQRMVVVRFGNSVGKQFDDATFLGLLMGVSGSAGR
jgi:CubicO group peptidase (beta-lactamase class C family)